MEAKGCVHLVIRDGRIANVFSHLTNLPQNCIVHLVPDDVLSVQEFVESHPLDKNELQVEPQGKIFDLGDGSI